MTTKFRQSEFIDFNTGTVKMAPIQLQFRMTLAGHLRFADLVRLFQCRIEVWQLGVAVQMVRQIEFSTPPSVWSHAAYGLTMLLFSYFVTIGKILNPKVPNTSSMAVNFEHGFRDVYQDITTTSGNRYDPGEFLERAQNGLYSLGSTPAGLWMHNNRTISTKDFDIVQKIPADPSSEKYYVNPHALVRTLVDNFPTFIDRLNNADAQYDALRMRFKQFFGDLPIA